MHEPPPWPEAWQHIRRRRWLMAACHVCLCVPVLLLLIGAFSFVAGGHLVAGGYAGMAGIFLAAGTVVGVESHVRIHKGGAALRIGSASSGRAATVVPYSRVRFTAGVVMLFAVSGVFVVAALHVSGIAATMGCGAVAMVPPAIAATGRVRRRELRVTAHDIELGTSRRRESIAWDDVRFVTATVDLVGGVVRWAEPVISIIGSGEEMRIRGAALAVDPAMVLEMLHYYAQRPGARSELGTDSERRLKPSS